MLNTYGRTPSSKRDTHFQGGELVEQNVYATGVGKADDDDDDRSMQSVQLVFEEKGGAESPEFAQSLEKKEEAEEEEAEAKAEAGAKRAAGDEVEKLSIGSGMEVKINLTAFGEDKDTPL